MNPSEAPTPVAPKRTTRSGINLANFEDVKMYKEVPTIPKVASVEEVLARLGHNKEKLLAILTEGLQAEAIRAAQADPNGWLLVDGETGKDTTEVFSGTLADSEDVNPVVLMFAKLSFGFDDIQKGDPNSREKKREAKEKAKEMIASMPQVLEGLQKKAASKATS